MVDVRNRDFLVPAAVMAASIDKMMQEHLSVWEVVSTAEMGPTAEDPTLRCDAIVLVHIKLNTADRKR